MLRDSLRWLRRGSALLLAGVMLCGAAGCGDKDKEGNAQPTQEVQPTTSGADVTGEAAPTQEAAEPTQDAQTTPEPTEPAKEVRTDFYISSIDEELPSMYEYWKDYFSIGIAITKGELLNELKGELIIQQANSMTCGNEMKPDALLDRTATMSEGTETCPVLKFGS